MAPDNSSEWMTSSERLWRAGQLFYRHVDMTVIEVKLKGNEYEKLCEFFADVVTIRHNVAIFHGSKIVFDVLCDEKLFLSFFL